MAVKRSESSSKRKLSDFPGYVIAPVFSKKALDVLREMVDADAEVLKLDFDECEYFAINITTVLDVVDYSKAKYKTFQNSKKIMRFEKYEFRKCPELESHNMFRIPDELRGYPFVSDKFKNLVEENGLTGFSFDLVWDSEAEDAASAPVVAKPETATPQEETEEDSFSYIGDLGDDVMLEIGLTVFKGAQIFGIRDNDEGKKVAKKVYAAVEKILKSGKFPRQFEDLDDAACTLGCLFGYALVTGYRWRWKAVGTSEEDAMYCVVSPDEKLVNPSMVYVQRILRGENIGPDGTNDNTIMLLWNLAEKAMKNPPEKKLTIFW